MAVMRLSAPPADGQSASNPQLNAYLASRSFDRAMSRSSVMSGVTVYADAHEELPLSRLSSPASGSSCPFRRRVPLSVVCCTFMRAHMRRMLSCSSNTALHRDGLQPLFVWPAVLM